MLYKRKKKESLFSLFILSAARCLFKRLKYAQKKTDSRETTKESERERKKSNFNNNNNNTNKEEKIRVQSS